MAYNTTTDYASIIDSLNKQIKATSDQTQLAALQSQLKAAEQSRIEKGASDINTYGKYFDSAGLNDIANLMATRSIGSSYDGQTQQANTYYDQARQNASNAALSRGMARSSYVQDRMANLDVQRANALTGIDRAKGDAIYNAKNSILDNYRTNTANALANEKNEFAKTIGAYSNDYAAEINKITNDGDASNDWKLPYLQAARNEKIEALRQEALKAQAAASSGGGGGGGGTPKPTLTAAQTMAAIKAGTYSDSVLSAYEYYYGAPYSVVGTTAGGEPTRLSQIATWIQSFVNKGTSGADVLAFLDKKVAAGEITPTERKLLLQSITVED